MERARRLGLTSEVDRLAAGEDREVAGTRLLEMVIGRSNFLGARFLSDGARAARSVGRIALEIGAERRLGTGVLVAPRLVMTNHHVIANEEEAVSGRVQFNYVEQRDGSIGTVSEYALRGDEFFVTDEELDFSIVAIEEMSTGGIPASSWGWHPLFGQTGKAIVGERVNILQHPDGRPQEVAIHENLVVDVFDSWVHYTTDTQAGSSGAPVFNNNWELAALHHAAVSLDDAAGGEVGRPGQVPEVDQRRQQQQDRGPHQQPEVDAPTLARLVAHRRKPERDPVALQCRPVAVDRKPPRLLLDHDPVDVAAAATVTRVGAIPEPAELDRYVEAVGGTSFDPVEGLTDGFYRALGALYGRVRRWEKEAPKGELMRPQVMASLWQDALTSVEQKDGPVEDAYGRRLTLAVLPDDLLELADPRAVVVDGTRLPEDVDNWIAWVRREAP